MRPGHTTGIEAALDLFAQAVAAQIWADLSEPENGTGSPDRPKALRRARRSARGEKRGQGLPTGRGQGRSRSQF